MLPSPATHPFHRAPFVHLPTPNDLKKIAVYSSPLEKRFALNYRVTGAFPLSLTLTYHSPFWQHASCLGLSRGGASRVQPCKRHYKAGGFAPRVTRGLSVRFLFAQDFFVATFFKGVLKYSLIDCACRFMQRRERRRRGYIT